MGRKRKNNKPEEDELEQIKEREVLPIIARLKILITDEVFLQNYPLNWKLSTSICLFRDITWSEMKKYYNWGFSSGKAIANYIDWIYIRPDVSNGLQSDIIGGIEGLLKKGSLDIHYFIVKTKAVDYFLKACSKLLERPRRTSSSSDDEADQKEEEEEKKSRKLLSKYFDDEAIETQSNNNI